MSFFKSLSFPQRKQKGHFPSNSSSGPAMFPCFTYVPESIWNMYHNPLTHVHASAKGTIKYIMIPTQRESMKGTVLNTELGHRTPWILIPIIALFARLLWGWYSWLVS